MADYKAAAAAEKELGTAQYKLKNFEEALKHYGKAFEIDSTDMLFLLNTGAVYLEMKEFQKCVDICLKAAEVGQENRADYQTIAKAYARVAKAYGLLGDLENGIKFYEKALANHRFADYLKAKQQLEKDLKLQKKNAYIDPVKSAEAKERGNELFKAGKFAEAIAEYTEAINRNPADGKLYSNRAASLTKLADFATALKDCDECIKLEPTFARAYVRKGNALYGLQKAKEAKEAFQKALELEPTNQEAKNGIAKMNTYQPTRNIDPSLSREEQMDLAMRDPEIRSIMSDPIINEILKQSAEDPKALQEHMKNDVIRGKIMKLAQAGVINFR